MDAGANVGLAARLFAALWPNATIVSLEPDRSNFAVLELNAALAQNILPQNVSLFNSACLQQPVTAEIKVCCPLGRLADDLWHRVCALRLGYGTSQHI